MIPYRISLAALFVLIGFATTELPASEPGLVTKLPGKYTQFAWGAGGKFLAVQMESGGVLVYDLTGEKPERVFGIDDVPAGDLLTAGEEKLIVVSPSKMMIRRWDFQSRKREKLAIMTGNDPPQMAVLGSAGKGPLLIVGGGSSRFLT